MLVTSHLKQANFATLVTDANLQTGQRRALSGPIFAHPALSFWNNLELTGKGHDYLTQQVEVERNVADTLSLPGDTFMLGWGVFFGMGKVTTTTPNGGNPTAKLHTGKPLDPGVDGSELPVATIYREWANAAAAKGRIHSIAVPSFQITLPASQPVRLECSIVGSGQETTGALSTPPALPASLDLLLSNNLVFRRGTQGSPSDVTSRVIRGSVRVGFGWGLEEELRRTAGSGLYAARSVISTPQPFIEWSELVDDTDVTVHSNYLAQSVEEVKGTVQGTVIGGGPETHQLEFRMLAARVKITGKSQVGKYTVYQFRAGIEDAAKEGANDVFTIAVQNTQTTYGT